MKNTLRTWYEQFFNRTSPAMLEPGVYHSQTAAGEEAPHRLHLRVEPDGEGILIIDASTILHLNQTAVEYAYQYVKGASADQAAQWVSGRYQVTPEEARSDYLTLVERIQALIETPDLDPVTYLDFDRKTPYSRSTFAPYRLDCALTYRVMDEQADLAPLDRVKRELSAEEWKSILDMAWKAGIPHVIFTGGEPNLRPDVPELIAYAEQLGLVTGLLTSGYHLSNPPYLHQVLQAGLDHVLLVLNPDDTQSWEALRDLLAEDIFVAVHLTIHSGEIGTFQELLSRLQPMGITTLSLSAGNPAAGAILDQARDLVAAANLNLIWDLPVPYSRANPVALELKSEPEHLEGESRAWLYVEPDGDVLPGQGDVRMLGNLLADGWTHVWNNARKLQGDAVSG